MHRLLLVHDDDARRDALLTELRAWQFDVVAAVDGRTATHNRYPELDVVALDAVTNDSNGGGGRVCRGIRDHGVNVPVMFLTRQPDLLTHDVAGLRIGIDDCLSSPYEASELAVRLELLIRAQEQPIVADDALLLHSPGPAMSFRSAQVDLTPTEYRAMARLLLRPGAVVPRQELWEARGLDAAPFSSQHLDQCVSRLRRKLRQLGAPHSIRAVRGVGHQLTGAE